jgi:hypothetical protein
MLRTAGQSSLRMALMSKPIFEFDPGVLPKVAANQKTFSLFAFRWGEKYEHG